VASLPAVVRVLLLVAAAAAAAVLVPRDAAAAPWCGTVSDTDRPAAVAGNPVRVLYAIPSDGTDRSAELAARISDDVEAIDAWWRGQDGARTVRFDRAAFPCGAQADIGLARLTKSASQLVPESTRFGLIVDDVLAGRDTAFTKYLVYYDGPLDSGDICGQGNGITDGTGIAIVYLTACTDISSAVVAAHELLHAFGALPSPGPPHACPGDDGHPCDSTGDLLFPYAPQAQLAVLGLDVGRDDYYGHSGSWFDVQDSRWLRKLDAQVPLAVAIAGAGTVSGDVPGLDCAASCTTEWDVSAPLSLTAEPARGQRFVRWGGACSGDGNCSLLLDAGKRVTALFAPETFRLSLVVRGSGSVTGPAAAIRCAARCTKAVTSHEPVRLTATARTGWRLKAWAGACRGSKPVCTLPMTKASLATATFVRRTR
jgi:hypothetical protein